MKLFILGSIFCYSLVVSIYSLSVVDLNGGSIRFNDFRGKKILIVNTATGDSAAAQQIAELEQLYQQHKDSLVIIAFPSNSFGNEPGTNTEIKTRMQNTYGVTFPIASKSWVTGDSANVVYQWLGSKLQNEMMNARTKRDFQKYLVDKSGLLVAKYDSVVNPLNQQIQNAIANY